MALLHGQLGVADGVHVPFSFTYANATARNAATSFTVNDLGKLALQADTNTLWQLKSYSPALWISLEPLVGTSAPPDPTGLADGNLFFVYI